MPAIAQSQTSLSLLVPVSLMPGEGANLDLPAWSRPAATAPKLFQAYQSLVLPHAPRFLLTGNEVSFNEDIERDSALRLLKISPDAETNLPQLEACPAMSHFDWAGVLREIGHAMLDEHFLGTPDELARVFTEGVREVSAIAALGFAGEAVPLLSFSKTKDGISAAFLGIWLADEKAMAEVRQSLPAQAWQEGAGFEQPDCILLDTAEVEGRGLKEALASAAMLAMVLGSATTASAADPLAASTRSGFLKSMFGGDTQKGEKLQVKTQKIVQDAPRVYHEILDGPGELSVIVNIGKQRAYLVKDGQIAFDTPISSAATGHVTPRGTYTISEKVRKGKNSTIYKCPLPGWMRLGETAVGMHEGQLPGYPASHGCIRMPLESALFIFDQVHVGTPVQVVDSWTPQPPTVESTKMVADAH
jgi:lipoprotein-anchoring transpeptidase ErfK/SrfK